MTKTKLKTVERKTTVSRDAVSRAFAGVSGTSDKNPRTRAGSALGQRTNTKKKSR